MSSMHEKRPLSRRDALAALSSGGVALVAGCAPQRIAGAIATAAQPSSTNLQGAPAMPFAKVLTGSHVALPLMTGELRTTWSSNHTQTLSTAAPLRVLDMYEHSYQMDFGAAAARYIDAFFLNVNWDEVNHRLDRAVAASKALRG